MNRLGGEKSISEFVGSLILYTEILTHTIPEVCNENKLDYNMQLSPLCDAARVCCGILSAV